MAANKVFSDLLLSPKTLAQAENFARQPAAALLITGRPGSGKYTLARAIAASILNTDTDNLDKNANYRLLALSENQSEIPIDSIRRVRRDMSLKQAGRDERRVVMVDQADRLSLEAQNAMLKTLEEPTENTHFILTAPTSTSVLPTIASRAWEISTHGVSLKDAGDFYAAKYDQPTLDKAWHLSQGQAGLMHSLLHNEESHALYDSVELAKKYLGGSLYERLLITDKLSSDRASMDNFLDALSRLLTVLHRQAVSKHSPGQAKFLKARQKLRQLAQEHDARANGRLTALDLALNLKV